MPADAAGLTADTMARLNHSRQPAGERAVFGWYSNWPPGLSGPFLVGHYEKV